jgi:hypothetical protein
MMPDRQLTKNWTAAMSFTQIRATLGIDSAVLEGVTPGGPIRQAD